MPNEAQAAVLEERDQLVQEQRDWVQSMQADPTIELSAELIESSRNRKARIKALTERAELLGTDDLPDKAPEAVADPIPDVELSDRSQAVMEETYGRLQKDWQFRNVNLNLPDHSKQMVDMAVAAVNKTALPADFPRNAEGQPTVKLRLSKTEEFRRRMASGFDKDYLIELAYSTTGANDPAGDPTKNVSDAVPTFVEAAWFEIQEQLEGIRNLPGIDIWTTPNRTNQMDLPRYVEYNVTASNASATAENVSTVVREGTIENVSSQPLEYSAMARIPRNVLMTVAPDISSKVTMGLAKTVHRITERQFALGPGGSGGPDAIFKDHSGGGGNIQIGTSQGANAGPTSDELLRLIGEIGPRETMGRPVLLTNWTVLYNNILTQKEDDKKIFTDSYEGDRRLIYGVPVYTHTYAPNAINNASNYFAIFFYPEAYTIHQAGDVEITMSSERYWDQKQIAIMACIWCDGVITEPAAFASLRGKAT